VNTISRPAEYPRVVQLSTISKLKAHHDYIAAKSGDIDAAYRLVRDLLSGTEQLQKIEEIGIQHPGAIFVAVHAVEALGKNKIPQVCAKYIGAITGNPVNDGNSAIVQRIKVERTGTNAIYRLAFRPKFTGTVIKSHEYILVDDVITGGGTLSELRYFIESNGGKVVHMVTLGAAKFSINMIMSNNTRLELENRYGIIPLQDFLKENDIYGGNRRYLTESEGRTILRTGGLDTARNRIAQTRLARDKQAF